ncbi:MAG TPA: peptidylprolyl isomerase [Longimicrobiales bacterium]|nr:peptidylprolyl isomerase [Longimicrobiales bacterium]
MVRLAQGGCALLIVAFVACAPGDRAPEEVLSTYRAPDGLVDRPDLRRLVELQEARDGAALAAELRSPDPVVRARAAFGLASVQDPAALEALLPLLQDPDPRVRADAAFAVGQMDRPDLGAVLFDVLKSEWDPRVRSVQLEAVGKRCDETAARRLPTVTPPELRGAVDRALSRCALAGVGGPEVWAHLAGELTHPDPAAREWSAYAFGRHPDPGVWADQIRAVRLALDGYRRDDAAAMHLIRALGRASDRFATPRLSEWLRHGRSWQSRVNAAEALARYPGAGPRSSLLDALTDPSVHVRLQAAAGLAGAPPSPGEMEVMRDRVFGDVEDAAVAGALLEVLAAAGDQQSVRRWVEDVAFPDGSESAQLAAVRGAAALDGEPGIRLLQRALLEGAPRVSLQAARALSGRWDVSRGFPAARPVFLEAFTQMVGHRDARIRALGRSGLEDELLAPLGGAARIPDSLRDEAPGPGGPAQRRYLAVDWDALAALGPAPRLHLETSRGRVVLRLVPEEAPMTVAAVAATARAGRYDGVPFHRVVPNFVAQGGDVSRGGTAPGVDFRLRSEFTGVRYLRGVLGMARAGKDTETTQFFVTHSPQPHLDGGYTAFGWVERGMEVVDAIAPEDRIVRAWVVPG